jgi:hypothetical protein
MKTRINQFTITLAAALFFAVCITSSGKDASRNSKNNKWTKQFATPRTYSLNANWSNTANPNGVWSYNQNASPITTFQTFWWGQPGWGYLWLGDGCIMKGSSYPEGMLDPWGNPLQPPHDWRSGDVVLHALSIPYGGDTTFVNITWTAPADGRIDISGRAWDAVIFPDRDVSWSLIVGGEIVAQRSSVRGIFRKDKEAKFSENQVAGHSLTHIRVTQGEVVEFRVSTSTYYGHFVGVEELVRFTPELR